jgi:hypothetical protein
LYYYCSFLTLLRHKRNSPAADLSILKDTKSKIEATVPLVIKHLQTIATKEGDNNIVNNGKIALGKEYGILESEWYLYRNNMKNCILNNSSKKLKNVWNTILNI